MILPVETGRYLILYTRESGESFQRHWVFVRCVSRLSHFEVERGSRKSRMSYLSRLERESESQQAQILQNSKIEAENTHAACATGIFIEKFACRWGQRHFSCFSGWGRPRQSERPAAHWSRERLESSNAVIRNCISRILENQENEKTTLGINCQKWVVFLEPQTHSFFWYPRE